MQRFRERLSLGAAVAAWVVAAGCGGATTPLSAPRGGDEVEGVVLYEAREATPTGASRALEARPARHVSVTLLDRDGRIVGETQTDSEGWFQAAVAGPPAQLRVAARAQVRGLDVAVTRDSVGEETHLFETAWTPGTAVVAPEDAPEGPAGALHIVDAALEAALRVEEWTGQTLPPVFFHWVRGGTTTWSFYQGERPAGSGRFALELLGGEPGEQATSDTDEHDDSIILHEFGHFVMDRLSTSSSPGGRHPTGYLIDPGLAWEEGRASWFSAAVLANPWYLDTIGLEPVGRLRVAHDLERGSSGPRGIGSEEGVAEILWDLADGPLEDRPGLPDQDADPVALGPAEVLEAMIELSEIDGSYPAISTFLLHLVRSGRVSEDSLRAALVRGGHPPSLLPDPEEDWPSTLSLPAEVGAKIDGVTNPAPSGGPNRPDNGFDAVHVYKVQVPRSAWLVAELRVDGSGRPEDGEDLDLELRDHRAELVAGSRGTESTERIQRRVEPGWYMVYVRDGGAGNRAGYHLRVWTNP